jgi:rfaE bifunctional protein nucleotidyltransferase chain/domain
MKKKIVVFTAGCFDLFHPGHLYTLLEASKMGDKLIVGISDDKIVRDSKGPRRPIYKQKDRAFIIGCYDFVDKVIVGHKKTFIDVINKIKPDIYVKGGDYNSTDKCNSNLQKEIDAVRKHGGEIKFTKYIKEYSTTKILKKIINDYEICNNR